MGKMQDSRYGRLVERDDEDCLESTSFNGLGHFAMMKSLRSDFGDDRERRTIIVERLAGSFAFTLQSYGIHYRDEREVHVVTYIDYVDPLGPAHRAGLRPGDVILSINGQDVERVGHRALVSIIQNCPSRIRMVVQFENCVRKVELHMKYIRLQRQLQHKAREYQEMCSTEKSLLSNLHTSRRGSLQTTLACNGRTETCFHECPEVAASSKSMPRSFKKSICSSVNQQQQDNSCKDSVGCVKKASYFCISQECDCGLQLYDASSSRDAILQTLTPVHQQRPRSCHFSSCYQSHHDGPKYATTNKSSKTYGGYGFGYNYSTSTIPSRLSHHRLREDDQPYLAANGMCMTDPPYYRRSLPKSAEDLLSSKYEQKCRLTESVSLNRTLTVEAQHMASSTADSTECISFYKRPPQLKSAENLSDVLAPTKPRFLSCRSARQRSTLNN